MTKGDALLKYWDHAYIGATVLFTVYSQLIMRWQVSQAGALPAELSGKLSFIFHLFLNPWILSSILATLFAGISWMLVMSRFEISYAYPWIGLNFVLMLLCGFLFFGESMSEPKIIGTLLVVAGIVVMARGQG
jgi:multidrug transporter EmrE-like cation transporter